MNKHYMKYSHHVEHMLLYGIMKLYFVKLKMF